MMESSCGTEERMYKRGRKKEGDRNVDRSSAGKHTIQAYKRKSAKKNLPATLLVKSKK